MTSPDCGTCDYRVGIDSAKARTSGGKALSIEVVLNEENDLKSRCAVNLHDAVTLATAPGKRVAQLSPAGMNEVCAALRFSLGCDSN